MQVGMVTVDGQQIGIVTYSDSGEDTTMPLLSDGSMPTALSRRGGGEDTGTHYGGGTGGHRHHDAGHDGGDAHRESQRQPKGTEAYGYGGVGRDPPRRETRNVPYGSTGNPFDRSRFKAELAAKPWLREKIKHISLGENQDPNANLAVIETMMNRAVVRGTSLEAQARRHKSSGVDEGGYYAGYAASYGTEKGSMAEGNIERALANSNVSRYATDNSSGKLAEREIESGSFKHHDTINGESFFSPGYAEPKLRDRWQELNKDATTFEEGQRKKSATASTLKGVPEDL